MLHGNSCVKISLLLSRPKLDSNSQRKNNTWDASVRYKISFFQNNQMQSISIKGLMKYPYVQHALEERSPLDMDNF